MNEKLIREALILAESYINDGKELPNDPNHPYYKTSEAVELALASLDAEKVEYCEWTCSKYDDTHFDPACSKTMSVMKRPHMGTFCRYCGKPIRIKEPQ